MTPARRRELIARALLIAGIVLMHLPVILMICRRDGRDIGAELVLCGLGSNACFATAIWTATIGRRTFVTWVFIGVVALTGIVGLMLIGLPLIVRGWIREARTALRARA